MCSLLIANLQGGSTGTEAYPVTELNGLSIALSTNHTICLILLSKEIDISNLKEI